MAVGFVAIMWGVRAWKSERRRRSLALLNRPGEGIVVQLSLRWLQRSHAQATVDLTPVGASQAVGSVELAVPAASLDLDRHYVLRIGKGAGGTALLVPEGGGDPLVPTTPLVRWVERPLHPCHELINRLLAMEKAPAAPVLASGRFSVSDLRRTDDPALDAAYDEGQARARTVCWAPTAFVFAPLVVGTVVSASPVAVALALVGMWVLFRPAWRLMTRWVRRPMSDQVAVLFGLDRRAAAYVAGPVAGIVAMRRGAQSI